MGAHTQGQRMLSTAATEVSAYSPFLSAMHWAVGGSILGAIATLQLARYEKDNKGPSASRARLRCIDLSVSSERVDGRMRARVLVHLHALQRVMSCSISARARSEINEFQPPILEPLGPQALGSACALLKKSSEISHFTQPRMRRFACTFGWRIRASNRVH